MKLYTIKKFIKNLLQNNKSKHKKSILNIIIFSEHSYWNYLKTARTLQIIIKYLLVIAQVVVESLDLVEQYFVEQVVVLEFVEQVVVLDLVELVVVLDLVEQVVVLDLVELVVVLELVELVVVLELVDQDLVVTVTKLVQDFLLAQSPFSLFLVLLLLL